MYKPGTSITLKDGNIYRTSEKVQYACNACFNFYAKGYLRCPCSMFYNGRPFGEGTLQEKKKECVTMYGTHQFPKLVTLCGNQVNV